PTARANSTIRRATGRGIRVLPGDAPRARRRDRWTTGCPGLLRRDAPGAPGRAWHDSAMTDQEARYDRIAEGYAQWWSPLHRPATLRLLEEIEPDIAAGARRLLDVGSGTGALARAAVARWPGVEVDGVDVS